MLKVAVLVLVAATSCCLAKDIIFKQKHKALNVTVAVNSEEEVHCAGWVDADGDIEQSTPSGCFNVTHTGKGEYNIDFTTPMTAPPVCVVSPFYDSSYATTAGVTYISTTGFGYSTGVLYWARDSSATFICFLIEED